MSALPRSPHASGCSGLKMTAGRFLALGETFERYELVNGVVVMSPRSSFFHNRVALEILVQLAAYAERTGAATVVHESDVRFSEKEVYRPDIVAYRAGRITGRPRWLDVVPDLIVEVLSEFNAPFDLITKRADYERFGVREYWAVDPEAGKVRCWRLKGVKLSEARVGGSSLACKALPGFELDLARLDGLVNPRPRGPGKRKNP